MEFAALQTNEKIKITLSPFMIPKADYQGVIKELQGALDNEVGCEITNWRNECRVTFNSPRIVLSSGFNAEISPSESTKHYLVKEGEEYHFKKYLDPTKLQLGRISLGKSTPQLSVSVFIRIGNLLYENGFGNTRKWPRFSEGYSRFELEVPFSLGKDVTKSPLPKKIEIRAESLSVEDKTASIINLDYDGRFDKGHFHAYIDVYKPDVNDLLTLEKICSLV